MGAFSMPRRRGDGSRARRIAWRIAAIVLIGLLLLLVLTTCVGGPLYYSSKYSPVSAYGRARPAGVPDEVVPEDQIEPHTCGLHAMSSLYRAYGLDPEVMRLRFRLGVDMPVNRLAPDSRGTIHPDMLRVLVQDGFETELLTPKLEDSGPALARHLDSGHAAIALVDVGAMHWIVITERRGSEVVICDSLRDETYTRDIEAYLSRSVYSLVLVRPR